MMETNPVPRRRFLQQAAAALAFPTIIPARALGRDGHLPPSERVTLGLIGCGDFGRNQHLMKLQLPNARLDVAAVCDVNGQHVEYARQYVMRYGKRPSCDGYRDFRELLARKDLDAVAIVVPDHWHALMARAAMEAGKDVYCEKPLTFAIDEGKQLVRTARNYGTVFQTGSQQRSDAHYFGQVESVARSGKIGSVKRIILPINGGMKQCAWVPAEAPPADLDWNFWLGPAPWADYDKERSGYNFRWFSAYSGGKITDAGAHNTTVALRVIGADDSGPTHVEATGSLLTGGPYDCVGEFEARFRFGHHKDIEVIFTSKPVAEHTSWGIQVEGSDGWVAASRTTILASDPSLITPPQGDQKELFLGSYRAHYDNWIDCIKSRERPAADVEAGHRAVTLCHLTNIAVRLGRPLQWDPVAEDFVNDAAASRHLSRPMRAPWLL